ncbi:MAG TPA: hypothetical protein VLK33_17900 [Terriglobales bacterium]|nr:hypothetical protein [Terriglobales bacterium]
MRWWQWALYGLIFAGVGFLAPAASAQTQSFDFGTGLGTLTYFASGDTEFCTGLHGFQAQFTNWSFSNFAYTGPDNVTHPISGFTTYVEGLARAQGNCPATRAGKTITAQGTGYTIVITPGPGAVTATISVPGYINPKYVVAGVIYAPPGSHSFVSYSSTNSFSSTTKITDTFLNSVTKTVKITTPGGLFGFLGGSQTQTQSTTLEQQSQDSTSVTASFSSTQSVTLFGPGPSNNCGPSAGDFIGVDHDCDLIEVWVNPVLLFTLTSDGGVQWNGYGFSSLDPTAPIHIVEILVGCLNGDIAASDSRCAPPLGEFQRTWAANENWPAGQGPGLTQSDLNNILAADPWGRCTPNSAIGSSACPTFSTDGTFTLLPPQFSISDQRNVPYRQGGAQTTWLVSTGTSTAQSQASQTSFSQTFGVENSFTGSGFLAGFGANVSVSRTLTWRYEVNNSTTASSTFVGQATIIGPACNGNPCTPLYPPNPLLFGTGTEVDIFVDHFFGTFVFVPSFYQ